MKRETEKERKERLRREDGYVTPEELREMELRAAIAARRKDGPNN